MRKHTVLFIFVSFILLTVFSYFLRIYNVNWDEGFHLHPDERFLTMVGNAVTLPTDLRSYLDPQTSPMSPYNKNFTFFVYGFLPIYVTKYLANIFNLDFYNEFTLLGRTLSAVASTLIGTVLFFLTSTLSAYLHKRRKLEKNDYLAGLISSMLYVFNPFSIQQAHFFTVDTFLVFFTTVAILYLLKALQFRPLMSYLYIIMSAICLSLAIACKITAILFLPLLYASIAVVFLKIYSPKKLKSFITTVVYGLIFSIFCTGLIYLVFRFIQPFYFSNGNVLDLHLNPQTIRNFQELKGLDNPQTTFPPAIQWQSKQSITWPLSQLFLYGLNPVVTILAFIGIITILWYFGKTSITHFRWKIPSGESVRLFSGPMLALFTLSFFIYQGVQFTMNMRYFYPLYPFFIAFSVLCVFYFIHNNTMKVMLILSALLISVLWTTAFMRIYMKPVSRITASHWIYSNIPANSKLAYEHWDDPLPLSFPDSPSSIYAYAEVPIFIPDVPEKWSQVRTALDGVDYYIVSSNRAWGSIPYYPTLFPLASEFYKKMFDGEMGLQKVAEFTSRPGILNWEINDDNAEESFTVYDHPKVMIFKITDNEKLLQELHYFESRSAGLRR